MPPAIAESILVDKRAAYLGCNTLETGTSDIFHFDFPLVARLGVDRLTDEKLMQMIVLPAHDDLEALMEAIQADLAGDAHLAPDRRLNPIQGNGAADRPPAPARR